MVTLNIWDTIGQERFNTLLPPSLLRMVEGCILVYDITERKSFLSLQQWRDTFLVTATTDDPDSFPFMVVGTKVDKENRQVRFVVVFLGIFVYLFQL
jgi:GTPase SAR1 family protein